MNCVPNEIPFEKIQVSDQKHHSDQISYGGRDCGVTLAAFQLPPCIQVSYVNILICKQILCRWGLNTLVYVWPFTLDLTTFRLFYALRYKKMLRLDSTFDSPNLAWNWSLLRKKLSTCYLMTSMLILLECYSLVYVHSHCQTKIQSILLFALTIPSWPIGRNEKWKIQNRLFLNYSHVNIYPGSSSSKNVSKCLFSLLHFVFVLMNHRAEYPFCVCGLFWLFIYLYLCCSLAHQLFESHHLWTWWQLYEKNGNNHHTHNPMTKLLKEATITESLQMIVDAINYLINILCVRWDFSMIKMSNPSQQMKRFFGKARIFYTSIFLSI